MTFTGDVVEGASLLAEWTAHDRVAGGLEQLRRAEQRARKDATTRYGAVTLKQLRDLNAGLPARRSGCPPRRGIRLPRRRLNLAAAAAAA